MSDFLLYGLLAIGLVVLAVQFLLLQRTGRKDETVEPGFRAVEGGLERLERELRQELARVRQEARARRAATARNRHRRLIGSPRRCRGRSAARRLAGPATGGFRPATGAPDAEQRTAFRAAARQSVETRLGAIQADNANKLEEMRKTVDEKLHATLEQRLGDSFKLVSERLEQVHKGLGEMQTLAAGVGDLKKVLTNVKTRGTWGEVQLEPCSTRC
jgi:DNA recombination protein RmuC